MKLKNKKIIITIALIIVTIITFTNKIYAINPDDWDPKPNMDNTAEFLSRTGIILGWIQFIGILVAVIALTIIGLKYLFSSVEGRTEYKKTMGPYVLGCFILMGVSLIIRVIGSVAI